MKYTILSEKQINSARTSLKQIPALFLKLVKYNMLDKNSVNFDIGGGKYDIATEYLQKNGITNLVYDKYNRTSEHNISIIKQLKENKADSATLSNVLNVINLESARISILKLAKKYVKENGNIFISIYKRPDSNEPMITSYGFQLNRKLKDYIPEIKKVFTNITMKNGIIICKNN